MLVPLRNRNDDGEFVDTDAVELPADYDVLTLPKRPLSTLQLEIIQDEVDRAEGVENLLNKLDLSPGVNLQVVVDRIMRARKEQRMASMDGKRPTIAQALLFDRLFKAVKEALDPDSFVLDLLVDARGSKDRAVVSDAIEQMNDIVRQFNLDVTEPVTPGPQQSAVIEAINTSNDSNDEEPY